MDLAGVATDVVPYLSAAATAYGGAVVQRATDAAVDSGADATVGLGRRLLARLFSSSRGGQVAEAVQELADDPADESSQAVLRAQVLKALATDPQLAEEVAAMLSTAGTGRDSYHVTVTDSSGVQIGSNNTQSNVWGTPPK